MAEEKLIIEGRLFTDPYKRIFELDLLPETLTLDFPHSPSQKPLSLNNCLVEEKFESILEELKNL